MVSYHSLGFTCWLTGLPGAGKSTLAVEVSGSLDRLLVPCELLDGDVVRTNLSKGLGFSREDRNANAARVGFVCSLLNKHGVSAVVAAIAPYQDSRDRLRQVLPNFIEVYVDCPLEVCIERDPKGLYRKALAGEISDFTGISSPYEVPLNPELTIRTHEETIEESVEKVLDYLKFRRLIPQVLKSRA